MEEQKIRELIAKIKQKKELQDISDSFVRKTVVLVLRKDPALHRQLEQNFHPKSAVYTEVMKKVRGELRRSYGLFRGEKKARERGELLDLLSSKSWTQEQLENMLRSHASTKERWVIYPELYSRLFVITGKPASILDLGCGLHPLSIHFMKLQKLHYHAVDISEEEVQVLNIFFRAMRESNSSFQGRAEVLDITETPSLKDFTAHDICFLLKMSDILDKGRGHRKTEEVIRTVRARYVVVSFPTITMSGKKMNFPRRRWIELMCERLGYRYTILEFPSELLYVVGK